MELFLQGARKEKVFYPCLAHNTSSMQISCFLVYGQWQRHCQTQLETLIIANLNSKWSPLRSTNAKPQYGGAAVGGVRQSHLSVS